MSAPGLHKMIRDLKAQQIDLEEQNEALRAAQLELAESRRRYTELYDFAPIGYATCDKNGVIKEANLTAARRLGVEINKLIGGRFEHFILPEDIETLKKFIKNNFEKNTSRSEELRFKTAGGEFFYAQVNGKIIEDPRRGKLLQTSITDISRRKKSEEALRMGEKRLRQIIDLVPHMIFAKDQNSRFILVNQALADAYGKTPRELIGKSHRDLRPEAEEVGAMLDDDQKVLSSGQKLLIAREEFTDSRGQTRYFKTIKIPFIDSKENEPAVLGIAMDMNSIDEFPPG